MGTINLTSSHQNLDFINLNFYSLIFVFCVDMDLLSMVQSTATLNWFCIFFWKTTIILKLLLVFLKKKCRGVGLPSECKVITKKWQTKINRINDLKKTLGYLIDWAIRYFYFSCWTPNVNQHNLKITDHTWVEKMCWWLQILWWKRC